MERFNKLLKGYIKENASYLYRIITKSGKIKWVDVHSKHIQFQGQIAVLTTLIDYTAKFLAEEKLKESEERLRTLNRELEQRVLERTTELKESEEKFRTIADQSLLGIAVIQNGYTKYVNDALTKITESSKREMKNLKRNEFINTIHPDDMELVWSQIQKLSKSKKSDYSFQHSHRIKTKTGKTKWIESFTKSINYRGEPAQLITMIDITEKKEAEESLRQSEKKLREQNIELKKLDLLKNDFITMAAHELKTPLSSIKGYTELLTMHNKSMDSDDKDSIIRIQRNATRLETYIKKITDVMQIDAEKMGIEPERVKLFKIVDDCISDMKHDIDKKQLNISVDIDQELELIVDVLRISELPCVSSSVLTDISSNVSTTFFT